MKAEFGRTAPTVAGLQEEPGCNTSGVADSALNVSNGKPCSAITAAELARRYDLTLVKAHRWLRQLPHWKVGHSRFTSEPMLAGWLAANVKNPPLVQTFDPLQDAVVNQAIELIERLVEQGALRISSRGPTDSRALESHGESLEPGHGVKAMPQGNRNQGQQGETCTLTAA